MIDLSKPHTTITVHNTCRVPLKGNPKLGPGEYHVEGDVTSRFNHIAARSDMGNGLYSVEYCLGCSEDAVDADKLEADKLAVEKAELEKAELEKLEADKLAAEKAELEKTEPEADKPVDE